MNHFLEQILNPDSIAFLGASNNPLDHNFDLFYNQIPQLVWESGEIDALIMYGVFDGSSIRRTLKFADYSHKELFSSNLLDEMLFSVLEEFTE